MAGSFYVPAMDGSALLQRSEQGVTQTLAVKSFDYIAVLGKDVDESGRDWIVRNGRSTFSLIKSLFQLLLAPTHLG